MLSGSIDPHYAIAGIPRRRACRRDWRRRRIADDTNPDRAVWCFPSNGCWDRPLFAAATKTVGSLVHGFNRTIDWRLVRRLATGSIPTTAFALMVLSWLDMRAGGAHQIVTAVLSIALLLTAGALIARNKIFSIYSQRLAI
jgi:hypothetical protein